MIRLDDFKQMSAPIYLDAAALAERRFEQVSESAEGALCVVSLPVDEQAIEDLVEFAVFLTQLS